MSSRRAGHRSHVSYIDASRQYYAAAGYTTPYEWATHTDAPFARVPKPMSECTIGLVTTSYLDGDRTNHSFTAPLADANRLENGQLQWDKAETHTNDTETFLPIERLNQAVAAGRVGAISPNFYGVPTQYSHRMTTQRAAPAIEQSMRADGVDIALLVPL